MTDQRTLATDLEAVNAQVPRAIGDRISHAVDEVRQSGRAPGLAVGDLAPNFVLPDIRAAGASLTAISPQTPDHSLSMTQKADLEFDVLSDSTQQVIREYRVQFELPADLQAIHLDAFQLDLRLQTADDSWNLPVPATFVIDRYGKVVAADVDADYRRRMEPSDLLATLAGVA